MGGGEGAAGFPFFSCPWVSACAAALLLLSISVAAASLLAWRSRRAAWKIEQGSVGQPGVAFAGMVNWVRRNSRAVNSAIFILYIRRGGKKKPWCPIPPFWEGVRARSVGYGLVGPELWGKNWFNSLSSPCSFQLSGWVQCMLYSHESPQHGILILCFVSRAIPILSHCPADTNRKNQMRMVPSCYFFSVVF